MPKSTINPALQIIPSISALPLLCQESLLTKIPAVSMSDANNIFGINSRSNVTVFPFTLPMDSIHSSKKCANGRRTNPC